MMGDRRVILIKGDCTKWYDEVIFIVKSNASVPQSPAAEAERIIRNYMASKYARGTSVKNLMDKSSAKKEYKKNVKKNNVYINKVIDVCLILVLLVLAVLVFIMVS